jgi:3'(2'), 5'-bisphosphate nucleotidase
MQRTYFGTPECGVFVKDRFPSQLNKLQRVTTMQPFDSDEGVNPDHYKLWLCGSMNRNQTKMDELFNSLNPINIGRVAGSGNKIVYMLDAMADYYINLVPGFKYWDMCASEALIEAKMGICVDASGKPLIYDHNKSNYTINEGIIIAKNMKVYNLVKKRLKDNLGMTIE